MSSIWFRSHANSFGDQRCNGSKVVYNASMIWGAVGPMRLFQSGQVYSSLMYFFIIGVSHPTLLLSNTSDRVDIGSLL